MVNAFRMQGETKIFGHILYANLSDLILILNITISCHRGHTTSDAVILSTADNDVESNKTERVCALALSSLQKAG